MRLVHITDRAPITHPAPDAEAAMIEALKELREALRMLDAWDAGLARSQRYFAMAHIANAERDLAGYLHDVERLGDPYAHREAT